MIVPEKKSIQDYFELLNKLLFRLNIIFENNQARNLTILIEFNKD